MASCVSIYSEIKTVNSPFDWLSLVCALELIACKMRWTSLTIEIANQSALIPSDDLDDIQLSDDKHAIIKHVEPMNMYSKMTAIEYPTRLFESNGILFRKTKKTEISLANILCISMTKFTTLVLAIEMIRSRNRWKSTWPNWLHISAASQVVVILSSSRLKWFQLFGWPVDLLSIRAPSLLHL